MKTSTGHAAMKLANQLSILKVIREKGPITRVQVQRDTGLSWGTVTTLVRELVKRRIIVEEGPVQTVAGRRPVELDINRKTNCVAGLRLGGVKVRAVVMDLKGGIISSAQINVNAEGTRQHILARMYQCLEMAAKEAHVAPAQLTGIGLALPGAVDVRAGKGLYAPHHPHWRNVPVRALFEKRYGVPCFIDHVNNCCAMGERWFGKAQGVDDFLCVLMGTGISVGIMIGGSVYRGADSMAGEVGHVLIDPTGPKCACGRKGCLEVFASGSALARVGTEIAARKRASPILQYAEGDSRVITARSLSLAAAAGDADALQAFREMGSALGRGLSMLINLFNPSRVILCGQLTKAHELFLPAAVTSVQEHAWDFSRKEIIVSSLDDSAILGAAGFVLDQAFSTNLLMKK